MKLARSLLCISSVPISLGGIRRAVGYEMNLYLDGSGSYDPDIGPSDKTGMYFEWYCRRVNESFPANYKTSDTSAGCFKDGHYNISVASASQVQTKVGSLSEAPSIFADNFLLTTHRLIFSGFRYVDDEVLNSIILLYWYKVLCTSSSPQVAFPCMTGFPPYHNSITSTIVSSVYPVDSLAL